MCGFSNIFVKLNRIFTISLLLTVTATSAQTSENLELIICHEANSYPPYVYLSGGAPTGILVKTIEHAAHLSAAKITFYSAPWLRCQKDVQSGRANALFAMVKTPEREKLYQFPSDNPDSFFLWQAQYPVFYKQSNEFDLANYQPNRGLAAPLGYVVTDTLKKRNWLSPYAYEPSEGLPMVAIDKLDGYVVERLIGKSLIDQLKLSDKVVATEKSLLNTNWYIPFNREFYKVNKAKINHFWRQVAKARKQQEALLKK